MSAVPVIVGDGCASQHFHAILGALLNASNDEYEQRLEEVLVYASALENNRAVSDTQISLRHVMAAKENERKAIKKTLAKLVRFEVSDVSGNLENAELGDWVSFYDVMAVVK